MRQQGGGRENVHFRVSGEKYVIFIVRLMRAQRRLKLEIEDRPCAGVCNLSDR
jgi:hypothetical protein